MNKNYDFIVIGAGSAGCVIATKIIEQTNATVLLLEAGPKDTNPFIHMPAGIPFVMQSCVWGYVTDPEPFANNRCIPVPQGKVMGGSSSVNGMIYVRGNAQDYDDWQQTYGCTGWGYKDVLPYFIQAENNESLSGPYHGTNGHLWVSENRYRHPLSMAYIRSAQELGFPYVTDFNGTEQTGAGYFQSTTHLGKRASTAYAYLSRVIDSDHLTVITDALTEQIIIENGKAVAVQYNHKGKQTVTAQANHEIIVTAGAMGTPKVLMLSGIGPKDHLQEFGIELKVDSPNVGKNYQDHLHLSLNAKTANTPSLLQESKGLKKIANGIEWLAYKHGAVTSNILESGGFFDLDGDGRAETQIHALPVIDNFDNLDSRKDLDGDGITLKLGHVYPKSRGEILLRSKNPNDMVRIKGNYLAEADDMAAQLRAVKFGLKFFQAPSLKNIVTEVIAPDSSYDTDEKLEEFIRQYCKTVFHPIGTCRMSSAPETSVVDLQLKVRGVSNLRAADSSVMPHITSGNTNAPVIMIAERAAEFIITDYKKGN